MKKMIRLFALLISVLCFSFVACEKPNEEAPNPNEEQAYFEGESADFCGRSYTKTPFNRSCPHHTQPQEEAPPDEWSEEDEYPITLPFFPWWRTPSTS